MINVEAHLHIGIVGWQSNPIIIYIYICSNSNTRTYTVLGDGYRLPQQVLRVAGNEKERSRKASDDVDRG